MNLDCRATDRRLPHCIDTIDDLFCNGMDDKDGKSTLIEGLKSSTLSNIGEEIVFKEYSFPSVRSNLLLVSYIGIFILKHVDTGSAIPVQNKPGCHSTWRLQS